MGVEQKSAEKYTVAISQQVSNKSFYQAETRRIQPGKPKLHILATVFYSNETYRRLVLFCDRGLQLFKQNHNSFLYERTVTYDDIMKVKVMQKKGVFVKIYIKETNFVLLLEKTHVANRIEEFLNKRIKPETQVKDDKYITECVRTSKILNIAVKIEFGQLRVLALVSSLENFNSFQRKVFAEIGRCLLDYANFDENGILLDDFSAFRMYVEDENELFVISGDKSLRAALLIASKDGKLKVLVKKLENTQIPSKMSVD